MKTLSSHVNEALKIGKNISSFSTYSCRPKTKEELIKIIKDRTLHSGGVFCDLNDIDTSLITDMSWLFYESGFNGDISKWDVSNVTDMTRKFYFSYFNQDISKWDTSNVTNMRKMFTLSKFNQDISNWKINKNCDTEDMFYGCRIKEEYKPKALQQ